MSGVRVPGTRPRPAAAGRAEEDQPPPPRSGPGPGGRIGAVGPQAVIGRARWAWRQLTSMRTALILLFLLAVASVPGSLLPQEGIDPQSVQEYYIAHPALAPWMARLSLFDVFGSPWFAAIYILLFVSLAGCVIPRAFRLVGASRQQPPRAPKNLSRLPLAVRYQTAQSPQEAVATAVSLLSRKRFRVRTEPGWVSAEKGYLRELGNILFHLSLLALLFAVGAGGMFGYKADRLLVVGQSFANTVTALDAFNPGRAVSAADLQPFSITLDKFNASYITSGALRGQPAEFEALIHYNTAPGAPMRPYPLEVNHPLSVDGVRVFLIGHGYAPIFKITDGTGKVVFNGPVPFIAVDPTDLTSEGVIKVPDAQPQQLGFAGVFLPTAYDLNGVLRSGFPAPLKPVVSLVSYAGNLNMNSPTPQSVYSLDTTGLKQLPIKPRPLAPGMSMTLPHGDGTLTFTGYRQWVSLAITYDPGTVPALVAGLTALAGLLLSFFVRRRRMFVRAYPGPDGVTVVDVGGLIRSDASGGFETEFADLSEQLSAAHQGSESLAPADAHEPGPGSGAGDDLPTGTDPIEGE